VNPVRSYRALICGYCSGAPYTPRTGSSPPASWRAGAAGGLPGASIGVVPEQVSGGGDPVLLLRDQSDPLADPRILDELPGCRSRDARAALTDSPMPGTTAWICAFISRVSY